MSPIPCLVLIRLYFALNGIISDCDETFNYWEPLNLLARNFGKQTWEYSPEYSIRSWSFLLPFWLFLRSASALVPLSGIYMFYLVRTLLVIFNVLAEIRLYRALKLLKLPTTAQWYLGLTLVATGMSHATILLLPSSLAMTCVTFAIADMVNYFTFNSLKCGLGVVFWISVGGLTGWPFVLVLAVPFLLHVAVVNLFSVAKLVKFVAAALAIFAGVLLSVVLVDSKLYNRLTVVPLNAVMYNVFNKDDSTGPNIFGVEPVSYYLLNLVLNFNVIAPLLYLGSLLLPVLNFVLDPEDKSGSVMRQTSVLATLLAPLLLWSGIFFAQPHKEERFLYPVYPFVLLAGLATIDRLLEVLNAVLLRCCKWRKAARTLGRLSLVLALAVIAAVSVSRSLSLVYNYSSPLNVYAHLPQEDHRHHDRVENVCVGREWYHFPASFFLQDHQRLRFVRSGFNGILPGDFLESGSVFDLISVVPANMNNRNLFELDKVVDFEGCDYYVDIDKEVALDEVQVIARDADGTLVVDPEWELVFCDKFIDVDQSFGLSRVLYVPELVSKWLPTGHVEYFNYCVTKRRVE